MGSGFISRSDDVPDPVCVMLHPDRDNARPYLMPPS